MSRRQLQTASLAGLLLLIVALFTALVMLGHATMSGGPQWSAGALGGVLIALTLAVVAALCVAFESAMDRREERRNAPRRPSRYERRQANRALRYRRPQARSTSAHAGGRPVQRVVVIKSGGDTYEGAVSLANELLGKPHAPGALEDAFVDQMVQARRRHRAARKELARLSR